MAEQTFTMRGEEINQVFMSFIENIYEMFMKTDCLIT